MTRMFSLLVVLGAALSGEASGQAPSGQAPAGRSPLIDNEIVTVWDARSDALPPSSQIAQRDAVLVYIAPDSLQGKVDYIPQGGDAAAAIVKAHATRLAIVSLKRAPQPP